MGRRISIEVDEDDLRAVCGKGDWRGRNAVEQRLLAAIPPRVLRPTDEAVQAWCIHFGTAGPSARQSATQDILDLHAAMPGGVPAEWMTSDE